MLGIRTRGHLSRLRHWPTANCGVTPFFIGSLSTTIRTTFLSSPGLKTSSQIDVTESPRIPFTCSPWPTGFSSFLRFPTSFMQIMLYDKLLYSRNFVNTWQSKTLGSKRFYNARSRRFLFCVGGFVILTHQLLFSFDRTSKVLDLIYFFKHKSHKFTTNHWSHTTISQSLWFLSFVRNNSQLQTRSVWNYVVKKLFLTVIFL